MAFDGIIVSALATELNNTLTGGKIEKIYQPEADELVFHIHSLSSNYKLYASTGSNRASFHLLTKNLENPKTPFAFCMLLRKHLCGGRITGITQKDSERILEINIGALSELGLTENKSLIFEIMGKHSNIILVDKSTGKIIDSVKRITSYESRVRQILPGMNYEYPPKQDKIPFKSVDRRDIAVLCDCPRFSLSKNLLRGIQGLSPVMAGRLADFFDPGDPAGTSVFVGLSMMREALESDTFRPVVYIDENGAPIDFHIFPIPGFEGEREKLEFCTVSECVEYYYFNKTDLNRLRQKSMDLDKAVRNRLDKLYLKKQRLSEDILAAENSDLYRLYGELLTANLHAIKSGISEARLINYYNGQPIAIPLDARFTASKNAQNYFKKYSKGKTAIREKTNRLRENDSDIAYLESVFTFLLNAASTGEIEALREELISEGYLRKRGNQKKQIKPAKLAPLAGKSSSGFKIMIGRNNKENDALTFGIASKDDIWLHAKNIPGSHVILFTDGKTPEEADIYDAAKIAAYYSKWRASENVPVDYTLVRNVKKPAGAKPGMVIFKNNKTVHVHPSAKINLELSMS